MKEYIEERAIAIVNYIIDHNTTVRQTTEKFGISKSTVHRDVTGRLEHINPALTAQARIALDVNKSEYHIRGGPATREKYQHRLQMCSRETEEQQLDKGAFAGRGIFLACSCILSLISTIRKSGSCDGRDGHRI